MLGILFRYDECLEMEWRERGWLWPSGHVPGGSDLKEQLDGRGGKHESDTLAFTFVKIYTGQMFTRSHVLLPERFNRCS